MPNAYRELFTTPGVPGLVLASAIARLPQGMIGIGIITMLVQKTDLYWLAGAVAATFTLANALLGPQVSRLVDRRGQRQVLPWITAFSVGMLLALVGAVTLQAPPAVLFVFAALAGTLPSVPSMIRARWTVLFRGKPQLHTAFSLDSVMTEFAFILGPPLAIGLSTQWFAEAGPLGAVVLLVTGVSVFLLQRQTEPGIVNRDGHPRTSPLSIPGLRVIALALLMMGVIGGSIDIAVVAFAHAQGWPGSASFVLAAYAFGSMIAGLAFGALRITLALEKQFLVGVLVTATTAVLPIFTPDVYVLAGMLFIAGLSFAPTMIIAMNLGTVIIPRATLTEGLTWLSTGISVGVALGGALAGMIVDAYGARAAFAVPIVAGVLMVGLVWRGLEALRDTAPREVELSTP